MEQALRDLQSKSVKKPDKSGEAAEAARKEKNNRRSRELGPAVDRDPDGATAEFTPPTLTPSPPPSPARTHARTSSKKSTADPWRQAPNICTTGRCVLFWSPFTSPHSAPHPTHPFHKHAPTLCRQSKCSRCQQRSRVRRWHLKLSSFLIWRPVRPPSLPPATT